MNMLNLNLPDDRNTSPESTPPGITGQEEAGAATPAELVRANNVDSDTAAGANQGPREPEAYFDSGRKVYWVRNNRGGWIMLNETQLNRLLRQAGVSPYKNERCFTSPLDDHLIHITKEMDIHYAGSLAGFFSRLYEISGKRILVTESPRLIEPKEGDWPVLRALIEGLLLDTDYGDKQILHLFGWLKVAVAALRTGHSRGGQALVFAGEAACGKSLLQKVLTEILGGRSAKPYQYMIGATPFNSDLFEAEHLMIEDEQASTDIRARRHFGSMIKAITVNDSQRCHAKNRIALTLTPFWRLSVSVNNEPENLMVLPPIDESLEDKLIILRARKRAMPMPTETNEQRKAFWAKLMEELPAFLHYLEHWEIPEELRSQRFGITHFHHPEVLSAIDEMAPELRLLRMIDETLFTPSHVNPDAGTWEGSAIDLERRLTDACGKFRREAEKLLYHSSVCGGLLAKLQKRDPERFKKRRTNTGNLWIIEPPVSTATTAPNIPESDSSSDPFASEAA